MKATATSPATRSRERATSFVECHIIGFIRREIGVRVTRRQMWQLLHLFFAFTVFLTAATSGSMVLSLGTLAYCAACYRPVSHLLKQNDDEKTDL